MTTKSFIEEELEKYEKDGWSGDASALSLQDVLLVLQKARGKLRKKRSLGYYQPEFVVKWLDIEKVFGK